MKKRSKMPNRILAFLMAALMAVTSAPITAFAADSSESMFQSTSTIIDDPISGTTGSGWDNIDGGSNTTPPDEGKGDNESSFELQRTTPNFFARFLHALTVLSGSFLKAASSSKG